MAVTQLCEHEGNHQQYVNEHMWLCPNETLFPETGNRSACGLVTSAPSDCPLLPLGSYDLVLSSASAPWISTNTARLCLGPCPGYSTQNIRPLCIRVSPFLISFKFLLQCHCPRTLLGHCVWNSNLLIFLAPHTFLLCFILLNSPCYHLYIYLLNK